MLDQTPAPFGDVTRRWTLLTDTDRTRHIHRLLAGSPCPDADHVEHPGRDSGACYAALIPAASSGDPIAVGWIAATHRPLLVVRGRALLERDASEWGAVCLEGLHLALHELDFSCGRWLRRRVASHAARHVVRVTEREVLQRRREVSTAPVLLGRPTRGATIDPWADPHPDLTEAIDQALGQLDEATRDGLKALADHGSLVEVADRHALTCDAVRQRVSRARHWLRPELAGYRRTAAA